MAINTISNSDVHSHCLTCKNEEEKTQNARIKQIASIGIFVIAGVLLICNQLLKWNFTPYLMGAAFGALFLKTLENGLGFNPKLSLSIPFGFFSIRLIG